MARTHPLERGPEQALNPGRGARQRDEAKAKPGRSARGRIPRPTAARASDRYPDGPRRAGQGEQDRRARIWLGPRQTAEAAAGRIALTGSDRERQATEIRARSPDEGRGGAQRGIQATTSEPAKRYPQYVNRQAERKGAVCLSPLTRLTPRIFDEGDSRRDGKAALEGGNAVGAEAGPVIGA